MHRRIGRYRLLARRSRPGSLQACSDSSPVSERPRTTYLSEHCIPVSSADTRRAVAFINNGLMYLFSNFRYYLEGRQIEYFQNVGITTTIHNYLTKSRNYAGGSWFWLPDRGTTAADAHNEPWRTRNLFVNPQAAERPVDRRYRSIAPSTCTPPLRFFTGRMPFLPPNQQRQSTEGKNNKNNFFSLAACSTHQRGGGGRRQLRFARHHESAECAAAHLHHRRAGRRRRHRQRPHDTRGTESRADGSRARRHYHVLVLRLTVVVVAAAAAAAAATDRKSGSCD